MAERLLLLAHDAAEVPTISALVQDATVRTADLAYHPRLRRLVLMVNRFRWEADDATRVRSALRIEGVLRVERRGWPPADAVLDLLALTADGDTLTLDFAAGPALRATVECIDLVVEDIAAPWPTPNTPEHR